MSQVHLDRTGELASPITATIFEGRVARVHDDGDGLTYSWGTEHRDAAGLKEICDQLQSVKHFTLLHPEDLISKGAKADIVGQVIGARIDGDHVVARILVTDKRAAAAIAGGMHELSLGYTSDLDARRRQRNIKVDHLALVPRARCGASCRLKADCADAENPAVWHAPCACNNHAVHPGVAEQPNPDVVATEPLLVLPAVQASPQRNIVMDELQKTLAAALADAATQKARADQLDADLKVAKTALTTAEVAATNAQAELTSEKKLTADANARADQAKQDAVAAVAKAKLDADEAVNTAAMARAALLTEAGQILGVKDAEGKTIDRSKLDDASLMISVIKHVDGLDIDPKKDPQYIRGVYDGALTRADAASASRAAARTALAETRDKAPAVVETTVHSDGANTEQAERAAMLARNKRKSN